MMGGAAAAVVTPHDGHIGLIWRVLIHNRIDYDDSMCNNLWQSHG